MTNKLVNLILSLLFILSMLLFGDWASGELKTARQLQAEHADLSDKRKGLNKEYEEIKHRSAEGIRNAEVELKKFERQLANSGSLLNDMHVKRNTIWDAHPVARKNPFSGVWRDLKLLDGEIALHQVAFNAISKSKAAAAGSIAQAKSDLTVNTERIFKELAMTQGNIESVEANLGKNWVSRAGTAAWEKLPSALVILIAAYLTPLAIKVFLYFVIAPQAAGRPPIRLLPLAVGQVRFLPIDGGGDSKGKMSSVSMSVVLREDEELIVKPEYLQSTALEARKSTRWILNAKFPWSSFLSGMYMLTRVSPADQKPVVVSATKDALSEIGILELAEGTAFVCQPRSLAGVIQNSKQPIRISSQWRLNSLHGWLTLQLRFLIFHGPGKLILKGCRGIRIESAGSGRLINQAATIGFSASIDYANTRCETFISYWTGKEDLFNDLFTGRAGVYVYEEMPELNRSTGITGRGLEGISDALLKIFGV